MVPLVYFIVITICTHAPPTTHPLLHPPIKYTQNSTKYAQRTKVKLNGTFIQLPYFYAPAYSKNSGRALSVTPVRPVRPSVRPYVPLSCPGHNSKTLWNIFMKLHRCIHHNKTMCHEQGRQLSHFWFLNYFPLT